MTTKDEIILTNEQLRQAIVNAESCLAKLQELNEAIKNKNIELVKKLMKEIN